VGEHERDDLPLDELRRAWRGLEPRLPAEELEESDAKTRASVEWMRAAWSSCEVPEPRVPALRPRRWLRTVVAGLAAAAVLLALLRLTKNEPAVQHSDPVARFESAEPITPITPENVAGPQLASLSSDQVELRSGPVRLILMKGREQ
jgi:hypothetical protein